MSPEDRAALVNDLRGLIENREKMAADVRAILSDEIPKAVAKALGERQHAPFGSLENLDRPSYLTDPSPKGSSDFVLTPARGDVVHRALKQPLYDTLIVPEEGITAEREISLFTDHKAFPNGAQKMRRHTNMNLDGYLGVPLEYDLSSLELRFEKWSHADDVQKVLRGLCLTWVFGQQTAWLKLAASGFKLLFVLPHEVENMEEEVRRQIAAFSESSVWPAWTHDMKVDGKPRRIDSTESFRCGVECAVSELHGPVTVKVLMQDTLYAAL